MCLGLDLAPLRFPHQQDAGLDQVAYHLLHVASDIAHLGELGGLDLDERRVGEFRKAPGDLRLADARRPDHQDVLGQNLLAHRTFQLLPSPAVAQRDGDGALGVVLADDEAVELRNCFARRERRGPVLGETAASILLQN
jgi:hypothetical protein